MKAIPLFCGHPLVPRGLILGAVLSSVVGSAMAELPVVKTVEWQPFAAQVRRLIEAADYSGAPFEASTRSALEAALRRRGADTAAAAEKIQELLDAQCLFGVHINPELRVKAAAGAAKRELVEQGWRQFLVKVHNEAGTTAALEATSPNALRLHNSPQEDVLNRWLELQTFDKQPLNPTLTGLNLEYRIVQLYSRDAGQREARFSFNVGQGTQDLGFRSEVDLLFKCLPAHDVGLEVLDESGEPTTASFVIKDPQGRVYPSPAKRLAPDFSFHDQVYRSHGEVIKLPAGTYSIEFSRGPESLVQKSSLEVKEPRQTASFKVKRWIDPSLSGWWSGDHHIHAAGCAHYTNPSEGVHAEDMIRHIVGEDLKVGANLTWGPCFDYQKQFFRGVNDPVSKYPYLLRYDIEVSGFGSHRSGHLCLLRLKDQMYPGGKSMAHWPTLCLNTLRWAKKQGALVGPAHTGWGLEVPGRDLPNYTVPKYDAIGANEYIVDVTHEVPGPTGKLVPAVDFLSMVDTPYVWELNIWYHTLNAGFRTRVSGETDFPCIYGERVGLGRSYVQLAKKLDYEDWCEGIRAGRNYVSDGKSHLFDFKINETSMGEKDSELRLPGPTTVRLTAEVAAWLDEEPNPEIQNRPYTQKPYWHIERSRKGASREVPLEVIVNGVPAHQRMIVADGHREAVEFEVKLDRSSWVALRILPSSHTNPIFVVVGGKPIRSSRRSIEWCLKGVDQCWASKQSLIQASELDDARKAYAHAREVYQARLKECETSE